METETKTRQRPRLSWATRPTCNVVTYNDHLMAARYLSPWELQVLGHLVDKGGQWRVGTDLLHCPPPAPGMDPRPHLHRLTLFGLASQTGPDSWAVTQRGCDLDRGRPHSELDLVVTR